MTIRHLRIFKAVCDDLSMTKAAERLYMTQPAVSHVIREMEKELNTELFDRYSRKVYLNSSGKLFLEKVVQILELYDELNQDFFLNEAKAAIRVGSSITIANFWLPSILKKLEKQCPETPVTVHVDQAERISRQLQNNEIDVAFLEGAPISEQFTCISFSTYTLCAFCSPKHPFSMNSSASVTDFVKQKLLLREKGSAIRDSLDSALLLLNLKARPTWTSVNSQALIQAAKAGLGVGVLPRQLIENEVLKKTLCMIQIENLNLVNVSYVAIRKEKYLTQPMKTLLGLVESYHKR